MKLLIFDTETTGLSKSKIISKETMHLWPFIVQFSYIIFNTKNNKTIKMYDKIIKLKYLCKIQRTPLSTSILLLIRCL